ncbi:uncharacterized protein LOC552283 [Apis mellifera]|uniref:glutathione transferase n=3 Tax=Apis TaxID=7459 RepID=A0A7M7L0F8_APIME|nr:uncharacterized protein LOC552283 [Apis mellifera]|eukprot:XP_026295805.1 uncharacterized protein LOC552283 [Apis mellifera]
MTERQPLYKLIYFNARGRAEHIRYIFAYAGIDYVDERILKECWPELKKSMPYGMLPVLEINGKPIAQSNAVARYLARKHNLTGRDEWEAMMCDVLVDTLGDLKQFISQYRIEEDLFKKKEKKMKLLKETIPFYLNKFEQIISENGSYTVGTTTTWADFVFAVALENFENIFGTMALENYPGLRALKKRVHEIPSIVNWLSKRPHTEFGRVLLLFHFTNLIRNFYLYSKMSTYKLTYFPVKGLGEPIRFLLSYAGISFEDERFDRDDWPKIKPTTPFGQVPVLDVDGKKIAQSVAISRYLAKKSGLAGKDDWEALEIDSIVDTIHDVRARLAAFHYEENEEIKAAKRKIADEVVPYYLERLDAQVKNNGGYFVGGALSWADLSFVALLDYLNFMNGSDLIEKYDNLKQLKEKVLNLPAIKSWLDKRPHSDF